MATGADYEVVDVSSGEEITNPGVNDVMVAFHKSTGALEKIDYNKLAKAIIEQYTGSTIGGAAQSVKSAVDNVNNAIVVKNMPSPADFNNYTETGVWRCDLLETNVTNGPPVGTYVSGFLFVSKYNSNNIIQRFCFSGSSKDELTRFNWNGTWSAWVKQPTRAEIDLIDNGMYTGTRLYNKSLYITADDVSYTGIANMIRTIVNSGECGQRWVITRVKPTSNAPKVEPFFGSDFNMMINCSSQKYGWGILMSDNSNTGMMFGQLNGGNWTWHKLAYAD